MNETSTHCQICARPIKARTGVIAHHGYERPFGWGQQTASCLGARFKSYEESRDRIPAVIEIYRDGMEWNRKRAAELIANPPETITVYARSSYDENRTYTRPADFDGKKNVDPDNYVTYSQHYEYEHRSQVREARTNVKEIAHAIEQLQKRYDEWKPVEVQS